MNVSRPSEHPTQGKNVKTLWFLGVCLRKITLITGENGLNRYFFFLL